MTFVLHVVRGVSKYLVPKVQLVTRAAFSRYLLCTNVIISGTLSGLGDITEQYYEMFTEDLNAWDPWRTRKMTMSGVSVGLVCHFWYGFLDKQIMGNTIRAVAQKIIIDQIIGSPLSLTAFFITLTLLEGKSLHNFRDIKEKAMKLYIAEWVVWPPAQFINFYFLPTKFRVLYDNTISFGYDIYTSYVTHLQEITINGRKHL